MKAIKYILVVLICVLSAQGDDAPRRVIVEISRGSIVFGEVISETKDTLVLRNREGKEITIDLKGVSRVVTLVEGGTSVTGTVHLRDGRRLRGIIILDSFDEVIVRVGAIRLKFNRGQIDRVILDPPFEETYQRLLLSLDLSRPDHLHMFVTWLLENNQLDLAHSHLSDSMLSTGPINSLRRRIRLKLKARDLPTPEINSDEEDETDQIDTRKIGKVLSIAEVNLIKAYEVNQHNPPDLIVPPDTRELLLAQFADDPRLLAGSHLRTTLIEGSHQDAFRIIRLLRAEEFYNGIQIVGEPESLRRFREDVHDNWLINRCGTNACHGSVGRGRFFLRKKPINSDQARYANLLMLDRLVVDIQWPLINYDDPHQSLLIQYALPRDKADHPHPQTPKWNAVHELDRDNAYQAVIAWIRSMRQVPRPVYPIEFPLPEPSDRQSD